MYYSNLHPQGRTAGEKLEYWSIRLEDYDQTNDPNGKNVAIVTKNIKLATDAIQIINELKEGKNFNDKILSSYDQPIDKYIVTMLVVGSFAAKDREGNSLENVPDQKVGEILQKIASDIAYYLPDYCKYFYDDHILYKDNELKTRVSIDSSYSTVFRVNHLDDSIIEKTSDYLVHLIENKSNMNYYTTIDDLNFKSFSSNIQLHILEKVQEKLAPNQDAGKIMAKLCGDFTKTCCAVPKPIPGETPEEGWDRVAKEMEGKSLDHTCFSYENGVCKIIRLENTPYSDYLDKVSEVVGHCDDII
ncbi:MAG: hypothetical protein KA998_03135 [Rickettsiaceae bacterium]|nr:hypothetical protein [Rickettsiaceae bacterium]